MTQDSEELRVEQVGRTMAAGRIIDVMTGGKFDWRSHLDESDFLESADWLTALAYADAALGAAPAHVSSVQEAIRAIQECLSFGMPDRGQIRKHIQVIADRLQSQTVVAGDGEPAAWSFELAMRRGSDGQYDDWDAARLSFTEPCVPEGSIRNLRALYATPSSPRPIARVSEDAAGAVERALTLARPIVEADLHAAIDQIDADWEGMSREALEAIDAAIQSGEPRS